VCPTLRIPLATHWPPGTKDRSGSGLSSRRHTRWATIGARTSRFSSLSRMLSQSATHITALSSRVQIPIGLLSGRALILILWCARGENCTAADAEVNNLRCLVGGSLPEPGYRYAGSPFQWPTIPDVLERSNLSRRIYQDPNNWTGLMHGCLAFESFRTAAVDSSIYRNGMSNGRSSSSPMTSKTLRSRRFPGYCRRSSGPNIPLPRVRCRGQSSR
jgi:hypothetical protein